MEALIKLFKYITTSSIDFVKTKSGKGMCCYKLEQISKHKEAIETLASACGWRLAYFSGIDKVTGTVTSSPKYYLGPEVSSTKLTLEDMKTSFTS